MKALFFIVLIALSRAAIDGACTSNGVECSATEFCYLMTDFKSLTGENAC
jgi:hypothetical protein